jgi:hypothetical protein
VSFVVDWEGLLMVVRNHLGGRIGRILDDLLGHCLAGYGIRRPLCWYHGQQHTRRRGLDKGWVSTIEKKLDREEARYGRENSTSSLPLKSANKNAVTCI